MALGAAYLVILSAPFHATKWSTKAELTLIGGTLEAFGVALVSIDFWAPWLVDVLDTPCARDDRGSPG